MPSVYWQRNNIVHAIRGCAKSAATDVLYVARIDAYACLVPSAGHCIFRGCLSVRQPLLISDNF